MQALKSGPVSRLGSSVATLWGAVHPRYLAVHALAHLLPRFGGGLLLSSLYRLGGFSIGEGTVLGGPLTLRGGQNLTEHLQIGTGTVFATDIVINLDGAVTIADNCSIGPFVRIYTGTHGIGTGSRRMETPVVTKPVTIGRGTWLGLGTMVLPGVTVGEGCVVAAGSVVTSDVEPNSYVAGNPAAVVRSLPWGDR